MLVIEHTHSKNFLSHKINDIMINSCYLRYILKTHIIIFMAKHTDSQSRRPTPKVSVTRATHFVAATSMPPVANQRDFNDTLRTEIHRALV